MHLCDFFFFGLLHLSLYGLSILIWWLGPFSLTRRREIFPIELTLLAKQMNKATGKLWFTSGDERSDPFDILYAEWKQVFQGCLGNSISLSNTIFKWQDEDAHAQNNIKQIRIVKKEQKRTISCSCKDDLILQSNYKANKSWQEYHIYFWSRVEKWILGFRKLTRPWHIHLRMYLVYYFMSISFFNKWN